MEFSPRVKCKVCRGLNDPGNRFCEHCGSVLREAGRAPSTGRSGAGINTRILQRIFFLGVIIAVLGGAYYAVDRYLLPLVRPESGETAAAGPSSSTTTTVPRNDRVVDGEDRYGIALVMSKSFPEGVEGLVLTTGETYPEAVCAAPLAAAYGGPVLLVRPEGIDEPLGVEIRRLNPRTVFLVGVPKVSQVKSEVMELLDDPTVTDLARKNLHQTAAQVAEHIKAKLGKVDKVVLVPADSHGEALVATPLAAAKGWPIFPVGVGDKISRITANAIKDLGATSALVVALSVEPAVSQVETIAGEGGSYGIAALVAEYAAEHDMSYNHTAIISAQDFATGLAVGPYLSRQKGILLLSQGEEALPGPVQEVFSANSKAIKVLDFIGLHNLPEKMKLAAASSTAASEATTTTTGG